MEAARQEEAQDVVVVVVPLPAQSHLAQLHHFSLLLCGRPGLSVPCPTPAHVRRFRAPGRPAVRSLSASSRRVVVVHDPLASFAAVEAAALHNAESYTFQCLPALFQLVFDRPSAADELSDRGLALPPLDGIVTEKFGAFAKRHMGENTASAGTLLNTCRPFEDEFIDLLAREPKLRDRKIFTIGPLTELDAFVAHITR
ncbi:hypothetical protein OPV22_002845 [Ensete ventricosum]|uniref:Glycosyltransferase N-terminal domain-containing protein n=1 Tax=Ensete ventricosum TaxID=4639 RepID=A0AAV8RZ62_ENSVE|nr:hypothetical protein OPV22_002845 [Ensete ventricosum]